MEAAPRRIARSALCSGKHLGTSHKLLLHTRTQPQPTRLLQIPWSGLCVGRRGASSAWADCHVLWSRPPQVMLCCVAIHSVVLYMLLPGCTLVGVQPGISLRAQVRSPGALIRRAWGRSVAVFCTAHVHHVVQDMAECMPTGLCCVLCTVQWLAMQPAGKPLLKWNCSWSKCERWSGYDLKPMQPSRTPFWRHPS